MSKAVINLETLACPSCMQKIEAAIKSVEGVEKDSVKVLFNASKAKLNFDQEKTNIEEIEKAINTVGFKVLKSKVR